MKTREEELQKEDFSAKLGKIEESVELKLLDLMNHSAPNRTRMHGSCRLVFRSKHSASKTGFGGSVSKEPTPAVSATEVIRELRMREASLQRELKQLQDECKQRLDGIAERLDGVICISPWREKLDSEEQRSGLIWSEHTCAVWHGGVQDEEPNVSFDNQAWEQWLVSALWLALGP